jgi:hypothetical protein
VGIIQIGGNLFCTVDFQRQMLLNIGEQMYCGMTSVDIGNCVTSIGYEAFRNCSHLTEVKMKPVSPPSLGNYAFNHCHSSLQLLVPVSSLEDYKSKDGWKEYADRIIGKDF